MTQDINKKWLLKKYPVKARPSPGASADDIHHWLWPLLQECLDRIILHVDTNNFVNESSCFVIDKILNLQTLIQNSLPQCKAIIFNVINRTDDDKASLTVENVNNRLNYLKLDIVDNSNIDKNV